ncbi:MAG TPA: glycosyltransferase family 39 protein [Solirubrobacteraceae bacterium]|nr:glycosyltransferase family 39 protein [Solirubrobacteraceae bacterium]
MAITALGAYLRLNAFGEVHPNPYYDAAVRSMAQSWHNFFVGAAEPAAGVSVDKIPFDLWLQVASVKLFGFSSTALRLPEALGATAAIPLLYDLVRRLFGSTAGLVAALALAVMPVAVLTGRSDTMDSLMMALMVLAAWCVVRGVQSRRRELIWLSLAGVALGLAFEVKLFEALTVVPALVLLYYLGSESTRRRRLRNLAVGTLVFLVVSLAWPIAISLTPGKDQPYALGSTDGTVWNAIFVFNGVGRLSRAPGVYGLGVAPKNIHQGDRGPQRLFSERPTDYRMFVGYELIAALALGALAIAANWRAVVRRPRDGLERLRRAGGAAIGVWLIGGAVVSSALAVMLPRYLETFTPAVAATLGIAIVALALSLRRVVGAIVALAAVGIVALDYLVLNHHPGAFVPDAATQRWIAIALGALAVVAVLSVAFRRRPRVAAALVPLAAAMVAVAVLLPSYQASRGISLAGWQDSGTPGRRPPQQTARLSAFLRSHQAGARYEVATHAVGSVSALIVHDGRPVLFLSNLGRQALISEARFVGLVRAGQVRFVFVGGCPKGHVATFCDAGSGWTKRHGRDVSAQAGLYRGSLYEVTPAAARASTTG